MTNSRGDKGWLSLFYANRYIEQVRVDIGRGICQNTEDFVTSTEDFLKTPEVIVTSTEVFVTSKKFVVTSTWTDGYITSTEVVVTSNELYVKSTDFFVTSTGYCIKTPKVFVIPTQAMWKHPKSLLGQPE